MTALYRMDELPVRPDSEVIAKCDDETIAWHHDAHCWVKNESDYIGYLPLPTDASSAGVSACVAKWLSRCSDEDVAAVVREVLKRRGVRLQLADDEMDMWVLETLKPAQEPQT